MSDHVTPTSPPSAEVLQQLISIVGARHAVTDPGAQVPYLTEWRGRYHGKTAVVLKPGSVSEVSEILRCANAHRIGVVPQAGNTGLVGGQIARPSGTDVVLSVERLKGLRAMNASARHVVVEAGTTLSRVQELAAQNDLMFPLRIASEGSACVGGAIATNAGGVHVLAHGTMRALTLGVEVVLANGEVWDGLRTLKKDNTGYDLKDLMIGSEGTLGVVTAAALKLVPPPGDVTTLLLSAKSLSDVAALFTHLSGRFGSELNAFEFMSAQALTFVTGFIPGARLPFAELAPWTLLIEIGHHEAGEEQQGKVFDVLSRPDVAQHILDSALATSGAQAGNFWQLREAISEAQKHGGGSIKHDISVPIEHIPAFIEKANKLVTGMCPGARPCPFGHFGDGNVHYNVSQPEGGDREAFLAQWEAMQAAVHDLVMEFDGSISAEHGIGIMKRDALIRAKSDVEHAMMRAIKTALDPNGILNPGKVL